jgi:hypothetical protein
MKYISIESKDFWFAIPAEPGVYTITALSDSKTPVVLSRVGGIDKDGVLYYGKTSNLRERLRMLWRTIQNDYKADAHPFGKRYKEFAILRKLFPISTLVVTCSIEKSLETAESKLIKDYVNKYGEVPPFNSSIPKK